MSEANAARIRSDLEARIAAFKRLAKFSLYVAGDTFTMADCSAFADLPLVGMATKAAYGEDLLVAEFVRAAAMARHRPVASLGPDLLGDFDPQEAVRRVRARGDRPAVALSRPVHVACLPLHRLHAAHDLRQLGRDLALAGAVVLHGQRLDHLVGVVGGRLHRHHAGRLLRGHVLRDGLVHRPVHRSKLAQCLGPGGRPTTPGFHAVLQNRMLKDGKLNAYWVQVNNNLQAAPNSGNETYPGYRNPENFIVVSDAYPTVTAMAADLVSADGTRTVGVDPFFIADGMSRVGSRMITVSAAVRFRTTSNSLVASQLS